MCQVNNSVIFSEKPIGSEEFLNQMVESLGIVIDRYSKEKPRKIESYTIEKNSMCSCFLKTKKKIF